MFTGIIQAVGQVASIVPTSGGDWQLSIMAGKLDMTDVAVGDSIAVNGVCLTVISKREQQFSADVSNETLTVSAFTSLSNGSRVNLEKALRLSDRLGGHLVSGHVDGVGQLVNIASDGRSWRYTFAAPQGLLPYIAPKGSITVQGVSLTVNSVDLGNFSVNLVPHTLQETNLGDLKVGDKVNLEVDIIARYLEQLLKGDANRQTSHLTPDFLAQHGFWR